MDLETRAGRRSRHQVSAAVDFLAVKGMAEGAISSELPASALQLHPRATVILDEAAASKLKRRDYYKWVFENKWRVGQK